MSALLNGSNNWIFTDRSLSLKAKGLYCVLLSFNGKPFTIKDIRKRTTSGYSTIRSAFSELKKYGFLTSSTQRVNGRITGVLYEVHDPVEEILNCL